MKRPGFMCLAILGLLPVVQAENSATNFGQLVQDFSAARYALAKDLSFRLNLPLPPQAEAFFRVAVTGCWESVSNHFDRIKKPGDYGGAIPELRNELWAPIHETIGIWEDWVGWKKDSSLLSMFHEPVLVSMPKNSIYFGGTDYGRFVITTVNDLRKPPPVFCITQNALADNTYAAYLRAVYGDRLWLPQPEDLAQAFQRYVEEVRSGKRTNNSEIKIIDGRVQISGALGVMQINGIICEMIFDHNKDAHEFFVEESYVLDWMYPYLEPHGLIMKLNAGRLDELPDETVQRDRQFWREHEKRLNAHPDFKSNAEAQKAFSKLRSAIAGLYVYRERFADAKAAFQQAIRLYPVSPEASFRLAKMYVENGKIQDAVTVMETYLSKDPPYSRDEAVRYLDELKRMIRPNHKAESFWE